MTEVFVTILLAIIQGITEWFPISSDGHLVMVSLLLNEPVSLEFVVALHFGTLIAVFVYFGKEITDILEDLLKGNWKSPNARMGFLIAVSAIPAAIGGLLVQKYIESTYTSLLITAMGFGITAMCLFIASIDFKNRKNEITYKNAFLIGIAQIFAMLPGISRSGTTISSGLLLGLDEKKAVRFSFLMSIPVIFGAELLELGTKNLSSEYLLPTLVSFIVGLIAIGLLLKIVSNKKALRWFAAYTLLLALVLIAYLLIK